MPTWSDRNSRYRARVNQSLDARIARRISSRFAGSRHIACVNFVGIARPQPVVRRHMKNLANALHRAIQATPNRANPLQNVRRNFRQSRSIDLRPRQNTYTLARANNCRATWLPTKPVAPVTSVVIKSGTTRPESPQEPLAGILRAGSLAGIKLLVSRTVRMPISVIFSPASRSTNFRPCAGNRPVQQLPRVAEFRTPPSTEVVSYPTCTMQSAQRGSRPVRISSRASSRSTP